MNSVAKDKAKTLDSDMAAVDGYKRDDLTFRIIGAAMAVHSKLGAGLYEKIYENALCIEFTRREIRYERQKRFTVHYDGEDVGEMAADLVVEEEVIVKLKSVKELLPIHEAQLIAYLKAAKLKTGLLINFNERLLTSGIKRISVCINLGGLDKLGDLGGERFWCARRTRW